MKTSWACSITIALLTACPEPADERSCPVSTAPGTGEACTTDGECDHYLTCIAEQCSIPEAMADEAPDAPARVSFTRDGAPLGTFAVEVAATDLARSRGLSDRPCMNEDWGMLFVYQEPDELIFHTRRMEFPIDIVFVDADRRVVKIHRDAESGLNQYRSGEPVQYVVELRAGSADETDIDPGVVVEFENLPEGL